MNLIKGSLFAFLSIVYFCNYVQSTEFVPVYLWGTKQSPEKVPALQKTSQDSFKEALLDNLSNNPYIIVFAEETLSPEDFSQRNEEGEIAFNKLSALKKESKVTYNPYVQNPINVLKHLNKELVEISIDSLKKNNIPDANVLIVDLNDAKEDELRFDMLKRHDAEIAEIYNELVSKHENVVALYTARHTSWVALGEPEEHNIEKRETERKENEVFDENLFVYVNGSANFTDDTKLNSYVNYTFSVEKTDMTIKLIGIATNPAANLELIFNQTESRYWMVIEGKIGEYPITNFNNIFAPFGFSYHCGNQEFKAVEMDANNKPKKSVSLILPKFQVQPIYMSTLMSNNTKFGDAYDCVGFTSIPIWSGLFVTFILLFIMTLGLTMIMDIKTMDRFDDVKGKTIAINAE